MDQGFLTGTQYTAAASRSTYNEGNQYQNYEDQVKELSDKYNFKARWGCQLIQNIIKVRAAFTVGTGIMPILEDKRATRELAFIKGFLAANRLDIATPQEWARESEIEGKILCILLVDKKTGQIKARYVPWTIYHYNIETDSRDYMEYLRAKYKDVKGGDDVSYDAPDFVFRKFGGRTTDTNETPPQVAGVLNHVENLDQALWDFRTSNRLFSSPTPHFDCNSTKDVTIVENYLKDKKWKIGKALITANVKFALVCMSAEGAEAICKEIEALAKIISGTVNVPVHFLGLPDLLSNRATADNLMELVTAGSSHSRNLWISFYRELFEKVLRMATERLQGGFTYPEGIGCNIPEISALSVRLLATVWLPLYQAGVISLDTLLAKIPEIDPIQEKEQLEEALTALPLGGIEQIPRRMSDRDPQIAAHGEVVE